MAAFRSHLVASQRTMSVLCTGSLHPGARVAKAQPWTCVRGFAKRARMKGKRKFVDRVRIQVAGGQGGRGVVSFENLGMGHKMRAVGGHGGPGGNVFIEATKNTDSLNFQQYVFKGKSGDDATGSGKHGGKGRDIKIMVPRGTVVKEVFREPVAAVPDEDWNNPWGVDKVVDEDAASDSETEASDDEGASDDDYIWDEDEWLAAIGGMEQFEERTEVLADLDNHGQSLLVARGGDPGMGNRSMPRWEQKPDTPHIAGLQGEQKFLELELKTIADVGLVGFPNAGKSTFLGAISRAKPEVAMYPFTTLHPSVGVLHFADAFRLRVADIPGLISGAHENRGLGHDFLKHIERTKVLLYVIDVSPDSLQDPVETLAALQHELEMYDSELRGRPAAVVANKVDVEGSAENVARLRAATLLPVMEVSAKDGTNLDAIVQSLRWLVESMTE